MTSASTKHIKVIMITLILILVILATASAVWLVNKYENYKQEQLKVDNQLYQQAKIQDTEQAYQDYINNCGLCNYKTQAQKQADDKHYQQAKNQGTVQAYQDYISNCGSCNYKAQAMLAINRTRYKDNNDGTITDKLTGLMWKRCSEGQTWTGTTCFGEASFYNWQSAQNYAKGVVYAGHSDWRVPSIKELNTLVYCSNGYQIKYKKDGYHNTGDCDKGSGSYQKPTINQVAFPNTPVSSFWSASPYADHSSFAWLLYFGNGYDHYGDDRSYDYRLRLLRVGQ